MRVISVNVGMPREAVWKGMLVQTAIFKEPVAGAVSIRKLNLAGDQQADLTVHGGRDKAVYAYPAEHYDYWREQLPDAQLSWGAFGENLTTTGLREDALFIGDRLRIGSATLMVTQPRMPCYKLQIKFGRDDMIKRFLLSGHSGIYFSVVEEGEVSAGSEIKVLSRAPSQVSIADINQLFLGRSRDPELLDRALNVDALPVSWKAELQLRARP